MGDENFNAAASNIEQHIVTLFEKLESIRKENEATNKKVRVPARVEVRSLELWRSVSAECIASFIYVFIVCGAAGGAGVGASTSSILLATALASGFSIATITVLFGNISGGHVNPAVSCAMCVRRLISPVRALLYIAAQCGGAIAGAAMLYSVTVPGYQGNLTAALSQWGAAAAWQRLGAELLLTCVVVLAYFAARDTRFTGTAPLVLACAYSGCSFVSMPYLNPARSLGPSFVLSKWENHWVYWLGPLGGAVASGIFYEFATRKRSGSTSTSAGSDDDNYDDLDKPGMQQFGTYRAAPAAFCPNAPPEPLYGGTKSLYCRSPPLTRANLHRSQSVYSKGSAQAPAPLAPAQSLYPLRAQHLVHNQNAHNAQREPTYGARPGPAGASFQPTYQSRVEATSEQRRPESVYGTNRRQQSVQSDDSTYGSYCGAKPGQGFRHPGLASTQY